MKKLKLMYNKKDYEKKIRNTLDKIEKAEYDLMALKLILEDYKIQLNDENISKGDRINGT